MVRLDKIDVCVLTKDNEDTIWSTLEMIDREIPVNRLIVVDASRDTTPDKIERYVLTHNLFLILRKQFKGGIGQARAMALDMVTTPRFAFIDTETWIPQGWYDKLHPHLASVDLVAGGYVDGPNPVLVNFYRSAYRQFNLCNTLMRTESIRKVGFDSTLKAGEDLDLMLRLENAGYAWRVIYDFRVLRQRGLIEWIRKQSFWAIGPAKLGTKVRLASYVKETVIATLRYARNIHPTFLLLYPLKQLFWLIGYLKARKK